MIYINPVGFDKQTEKEAQIQIDNSLDLGWKNNDILLVTNFPFEYQGINAVVLESDVFCDVYKYASKITSIVRLFELGLVEKDQLYWFHDLDAWQNYPIDEKDIDLEKYDAGFTDYCRLTRWNAGSFFFKYSARDVFEMISSEIYKRGKISTDYKYVSEESVLLHFTDNDTYKIATRIKRLNNTYNFGLRRIGYCYEQADKPLKVLHFHPENPNHNTLAIALHGRNSLKRPLMSDRLIKIFKKYGYS